jgi:hypothetical protein
MSEIASIQSAIKAWWEVMRVIDPWTYKHSYIYIKYQTKRREQTRGYQKR